MLSEMWVWLATVRVLHGWSCVANFDYQWNYNTIFVATLAYEQDD